jgi:hypothetical protein
MAMDTQEAERSAVPTGAGQEATTEPMERVREMGRAAAGEASGLKDEFSAQARRVLDDVRAEAGAQAEERAGRLAENVRQLATRLNALAEGRNDEAGPLPDYARRAANRAGSLAEMLSNRNVDQMLDDVRRTARRRPGLFLVSAGLAGVTVGRVTRNMRAAGNGSSGNGSATSNSPIPGGSASQWTQQATTQPEYVREVMP